MKHAKCEESCKGISISRKGRKGAKEGDQARKVGRIPQRKAYCAKGAKARRKEIKYAKWEEYRKGISISRKGREGMKNHNGGEYLSFFLKFRIRVIRQINIHPMYVPELFKCIACDLLRNANIEDTK